MLPELGSTGGALRNNPGTDVGQLPKLGSNFGAAFKTRVYFFLHL